MDSFFSSIEVVRNPKLKGLPVIVGGHPGVKRGVVSTASYEARAYKVHSGLSLSEAKRLCPNGIFLSVDMKKYQETSLTIIDILNNYSPVVVQRSIDEAYLDLTGTQRLLGPPVKVAENIRAKIMEKTGLTASFGAASSIYVAKIASTINKPAGFFEVKSGEEEAFIKTLPLNKLYGVGEALLKRLNNAGIFTTKLLHDKSLEYLTLLFGLSTGHFLYNATRGQDSLYTIAHSPKKHSISSEHTFDVDIKDIFEANLYLMDLCYIVMTRLLKEGGVSNTIGVKIKYSDFQVVSASEKVGEYISNTSSLFERVKVLFQKKVTITKGIRLLGVSLENINKSLSEPLRTLFDTTPDKERLVERAVIKINKKYGDGSVKRGDTRILS